MICGIPIGDDAFIYATLDKVADAVCLDIHCLIESIFEHSKYAAFSMAFFLLLHEPCGILSGSDSPEADEVLLRQD
jgi:hypothetical protein